MRLLFVVQRYGREVFGGAEQFTKSFATRLAGRGHDVEVVTSCAVSYVDWADVYEPGEETIDGVTVHRLPVERPRDNEIFNPLNNRVIYGSKPVPPFMQQEWMRQQGPLVAGLGEWLAERVPQVDVTVFTTYLYATTYLGLPRAAPLGPTLLHPTAHDEPPLYLPLFNEVFSAPSAFGFLAPEEAELVARRFGVRRRSITLGIGTELDVVADAPTFRDAFGLDDEPYLVFVGRLDPHKGTEELFHHFVRYKERNPGPLKLVLVGEPIKPLPLHDDIVVTGFVDQAVRDGAIAGAVALVQPSYLESFSLVLIEAFALGVPAIVQGACAVLAGHAERSGAAFAYRGYREFEAAVDLLTGDEVLARRMGAAGRAYVESNYEWDDVLSRYEAFLLEIAR